jgi:sulfite exporter TauE/SafE
VPEVQTISAALLAGLVTSIHCAGMCGPLACSVSTLKGNEAQRQMAQILYHLGRLLSYGTIGALCGLLGQQPLKWIFATPAVVLPWMLAAVFLLTAFGLWKKLPRPAFLTKIFARARLRAFRLSSTRGGLLLGLATPLLPCGPLYLLFGASLLTGSALRGAEFALAFGMGTIPLLWVAQQSLGKIRTVLPAAQMAHLQRALALVAAGVMIWRLQGTLPSDAPTTEANGTPPAIGDTALPSCCH